MHGTVTKCCFNVGPALQTVAKIVPTLGQNITSFAHIIFDLRDLMLVHHLRRWPNSVLTIHCLAVLIIFSYYLDSSMSGISVCSPLQHGVAGHGASIFIF